MGSREGLMLREKALEALEKSTKMLQVAVDLFEQGNARESARVRKEAQTQRMISTLLMSEAFTLDRNPGAFRSEPSRYIGHHQTPAEADTDDPTDARQKRNLVKVQSRARPVDATHRSGGQAVVGQFEFDGPRPLPNRAR